MGFSLTRATCRVSAGTTWVAPRIRAGVDKLDAVRYSTTRLESPKQTDTTDIRTADYIARRTKAASATLIHSSPFGARAAHWAGLAGVGFINLDRSGALVIQLRDQPGVAGATHLLRL